MGASRITNEHEVVDTDSSYGSKKFLIVILGLGLILAGGILAAKMLGFATSYQTYTGSVIALIALYVTGNVSEKFLAGKVNASVKVAALNADDCNHDVQKVDAP